MNRRSVKNWWMGLFILLLGVALAACDSQSPVENEADTTEQAVAELTSELSQDLSLSGSQQQALQGAVDRNRHRMHEPGFLWTLAAELQATLSDEQKQRLFDLAAQRADGGPGMGRPGGPGHGGPGGLGPGNRPGHGGPGHGDAERAPCFTLDDVLTDAQQAAIEEIRERYRAQIEPLLEARRNETITPEEFRAQMEALRAAMQAEIDALLTDEQKADIEARREACRAEGEAEREARREAERAAMIEALGLTGEQVAALDALHEAQKAERDALLAQLDAGTLTREDVQTALAALHDAADAALQDLFDETQWEIKLIHDALASRMRGIAGRRGPGGFGRPSGG